MLILSGLGCKQGASMLLSLTVVESHSKKFQQHGKTGHGCAVAHCILLSYHHVCFNLGQDLILVI